MLQCLFFKKVHRNPKIPELPLYLQEQHGIKKPKTCKCGKKFQYDSFLARHLDHHDPKSVKKRFKCQKCDSDFSENYSLNRHMRTIHKNSQSKRCLKTGINSN